MKRKILIADDEESIRYTFTEFLTSGGYQVETADSLSSVIKKMQAGSYDLLFLDIGLGLDNGVHAIEGLRVLQPNCDVVIITGNPRLQSLVEAKKCGALDYLVKPIRQASLLYNVRKFLDSKVVMN
ncbi:MAG: response regulator [Desulfuromonadales bacterium]|nr:response regulator [Desulfuromonadales bacterium]